MIGLSLLMDGEALVGVMGCSIYLQACNGGACSSEGLVHPWKEHANSISSVRVDREYRRFGVVPKELCVAARAISLQASMFHDVESRSASSSWGQRGSGVAFALRTLDPPES